MPYGSYVCNAIDPVTGEHARSTVNVDSTEPARAELRMREAEPKNDSPTPRPGTLPFTGTDVEELLAGGVLLLAFGASLAFGSRRRRRNRTPSSVTAEYSFGTATITGARWKKTVPMPRLRNAVEPPGVHLGSEYDLPPDTPRMKTRR